MKINQLLQKIPSGAVVTTAWLAARGVSADQARKLAGSGWLQRVGQGAYSRAGDALSWESAVFALQADRATDAPSFWPGGPTALALQGFAHYLPLGRETLHLYSGLGSRLPRWATTASWVGPVRLHPEKRLSSSLPGSFTPHHPGGKPFGLLISSAERAILEWIAITPNELLFASALIDTLNGLNTLRPRPLQALLEGCGSVRTKRAFLLLARHAGHAWYARLDLQRLNLGAGKRQLWPGGKLDRQFQLIVPEGFADAD